MISPILARAGTDTTATRFIPLASTVQTTPNATEANSKQPMPDSGTLSNFFVNRPIAPGVGTSVTYTVRKNGVNTGITLTISDTATTGSDTTHSDTYVAGDLYDVTIVPTGTVATSTAAYSIENNSTGQALLTSEITSPSTTVPNYLGLQNGLIGSTAPTTNATVIPTPGVIDRAYLNTSVTVGAAKSYTITLVVNGVDTALTTSVSGNVQTQNSDLTHTVSVNAGDTAYWRIDPSGTPGAARTYIAARFTPTTDGESIQTFASTTNLSVSTSQFSGVHWGTASYVSTGSENARADWLGTTFDLKKLYVVHSVAPTGATKTYTSVVRSNLANTIVTTAVVDTATTNNDTSHTGTHTGPAWVGMNTTGSNTPTVSALAWGFVTYRAPVVVGAATGGTLLLMGVG